MGARLTFVHAADLHLGAPCRGLRALNEKWADRLLEAIPEAFDRVIQAAVRNEVDFVVFAGDIFDTSRPSYADYARFFAGLRVLERAGIPVYLCTGNHDPYTSWECDFGKLPDNATMFSAEHPSFALYERDGAPVCVLAGRGYYNQTWPSDVPIAEGLTRSAANEALGARGAQAPFGVGVIHTGLDMDPRNAPTDARTLMAAGFDYWALGHIHKKQLIPPENPRIGYSGCIQGRDIAETGERGVYLVTLAEGEPNCAKFVPTASIVWQRLDVDVFDCANINDVVDKVLRELFRVNGKAHCEEMCVRVTLVGRTRLHRLFARPGVIDDMRKTINTTYAEFFCDALVDRTVAPIDKRALRREGLFPSTLLRISDGMRKSGDDLAAYVQDEFLARNLQPPSLTNADIEELVAQAEDLVLDLVAREDSQ